MGDVLHVQGPVLTGRDEVVDGLWGIDGRVALTPPGPGHDVTTLRGWALPGLVDAHCHVGLDAHGAVDAATSEKQATTDRDAGTLLIRDAGSPADTRWIERGAHDLLDVDPDAERSASGIPRGRSLYGSLPAQLEQEDSFVTRLKALLALRAEHGIATASQVDVPDVAHPGMLVLVHRLDGGDPTLEDALLQVTVLNFTGERIEGTVRSDSFTPRMSVVDARDGGEIGWVDDLHSFGVWLSPYSGLFLLLKPGTREDVAG